ncbi:pectinesterase QRT1-like [Prosopis cineraria]|uniref:pectinesterase QRT1-like n=1 Tax=Prosopis cineraria TaxID=364024 RepID=UPI00241069BD|nr:pectinesterase QRT1-like [Prosopis cineraria]
MSKSSVKLVILLLVATIATVGADLPRKGYIEWQDFVVTPADLRKGRVIVVDKSGTGDSTTIQGALNLIPDSYNARIKIVINPGIYDEILSIPQNKSHISFIGRPSQPDGYYPLITGSRKASDKDENGHEIGSVNTATLEVLSDYFVATAITVRNNAVATGYGDQAAAIRIDGDKAMFYRVTFLGNQDTLLDDFGTHFFYHCYIEGSVDFIWGTATSLYEDCTIHSTRSSGSITAHDRQEADDNTGYIFQGCKIQGNGPTVLGRAWGRYSRVIYAFCTMDDMIDPLGWNNMDDPSKESTVMFGEYMNEGPGSNRNGRLPWSQALSDAQALRFVGRTFINGSEWLRL